MRELTLEEVDTVAGGVNVVYVAAGVAVAGMLIAAAYGCDFSFSKGGIMMTCLAK